MFQSIKRLKITLILRLGAWILYLDAECYALATPKNKETKQLPVWLVFWMEKDFSGYASVTVRYTCCWRSHGLQCGTNKQGREVWDHLIWGLCLYKPVDI